MILLVHQPHVRLNAIRCDAARIFSDGETTTICIQRPHDWRWTPMLEYPFFVAPEPNGRLDLEAVSDTGL